MKVFLKWLKSNLFRLIFVIVAISVPCYILIKLGNANLAWQNKLKCNSDKIIIDSLRSELRIRIYMDSVRMANRLNSEVGKRILEKEAKWKKRLSSE